MSSPQALHLFSYASFTARRARIISTAMIPFIDIAISILELSKAALEVVPIPGVSIAIDTLIALFDIIKGLKANQQAVESLVQELLGLSAAVNAAVQHAQRCQPFSSPNGEQAGEIYYSGKSPLEDRIDRLRTGLLRLAVEAAKLQSGSRWKRLFRSSQDLRVIRRLKQEAKLVLTEFRLGCDLSVEALLCDVAATLASMQRQTGGQSTQTLEADA
ncbi:hypothetical protein FKP32DRAFT_1056488 [Trametes sanguinea]|nr:hypothetical protein FKP32DRAFT_1056488 [Trametes sanguinea]